MKKYKCGLVIMRAQPLHNKHVEIIKTMLDECEESIIVLGSIQENRTLQNPFTFTERNQMLNNIFSDEIKNNLLQIFGAADIHNAPRWVNYILNIINKHPDIYYCGTYNDGKLFAKAKIPLRLFDRKTDSISGSQIRSLLQKKDSYWEKLVPAININLIKKIQLNK